jgi:tRNA U34 5-methylaminomethyl-2-thiouridine-forming methyltransferase MnmC
MQSYRVTKQLYPAPSGSDPGWAKRDGIYVSKLSGSNDVEYVFTGSRAIFEAYDKMFELSASDSSGRRYRIDSI